MESFGIRPDIGFYNQMIKQRAFRGDHKHGLDALNELSEQAGLYILEVKLWFTRRHGNYRGFGSSTLFIEDSDFLAGSESYTLFYFDFYSFGNVLPPDILFSSLDQSFIKGSLI